MRKSTERVPTGKGTPRQRTLAAVAEGDYVVQRSINGAYSVHVDRYTDRAEAIKAMERWATPQAWSRLYEPCPGHGVTFGNPCRNPANHADDRPVVGMDGYSGSRDLTA